MESYITVDKNMVVAETIGNTEVVWHDIKKPPFSIHGLEDAYSSDFYHRVPFDVAKATSEGVELLAKECVGGRVRFSTDSPYIAIRAKFLAVGKSSHLTLISSAGFDIYTEGEFGSRFIKEFRMPFDMTDYYEQVVDVSNGKMQSYTINFPVHSVVESVEIGLKPNSKIDYAKPYRSVEPVVFYGSSIVHGTGACRPGTVYSAMLSRALNLDYRNIGFSGQAKGEDVMAEWLSTLPMSVFVCDYDHNAPTIEHLEATHHRFYEIIRKNKPNVPYIMITKPDFWTQHLSYEENLKRRDIIMQSYLKARAKGDKNVYFIDGTSFFYSPHQYETSLDGCHPNDVGYVRMSEAIGTVIRHILEK